MKNTGIETGHEAGEEKENEKGNIGNEVKTGNVLRELQKQKKKKIENFVAV